jgi:hypothetical protein
MLCKKNNRTPPCNQIGSPVVPMTYPNGGSDTNYVKAHAPDQSLKFNLRSASRNNGVRIYVYKKIKERDI